MAFFNIFSGSHQIFSKKMSLKPHTVLSRNRLPLDPLVHYLRALPIGNVCGHIIF
eukprot:UN23725